jgi:sigma-B regulation protein RsbU (phosphoserine phosphatase)
MDHGTGRKLPLGLAYGALALLFVWAAAYRIPSTADLIRTIIRPQDEVAAPMLVAWPDGIVLTAPKDLLERSEPPVQLGDRLVSVAGRPFRQPKDLSGAFTTAGPHGSVPLVVARKGSDGRERTFDVLMRMRSVAEGPHSTSVRVLFAVLGVFMPWVCFLVGFWVAAVRPRDPLAWLVLLMLLGFAQAGALQQETYDGWPDLLRIPGAIYAAALGTTWPIWFALFGVHFAGRLDWERRHPWIPFLVLAPYSLFAVASLVTGASAAVDARGVVPFVRLVEPVQRAAYPSAVAAISFFFLVMGWKGGVTTAPDARRRLRVLMWGATIALTPPFILGIVQLVGGRSLDSLPMEVALPALLVIVVFPLTLAYVILVDKAMDARVVVRQGLKYAATRGAIRVLVVGSMLAVVWNFWILVDDPSTNRRRKLSAIGWSMTFAIVMPRVAKKALAWTDRRFFREAYDAERVLTELSEEVRSIVDTDTLLDTLLERIGTTLHVDRLAVFLREGDLLVPSRAKGYSSFPQLAFAPAEGAIRRVAETGKPFRVRHDDPDSPIRRSQMKDEARDLLDALDVELLLPLLGRKELLGVVTLGPKRSEEPYSPSDTKLLGSVATQTGLALENSRLTARIAHEIAGRERMSREIEIAREVQSKLFPQHIPVLPGIECAGFCRPAQGVGGDYYDFLALAGGRLGVALGDVAGKGIPAALLMASLQASLRGQRLSGPANLAELMDNLNLLIYEASPDNRYATFFYGELDPGTRRLDYVNAGHNAPMLFRREGGPIVRLPATGPVIGLLGAGAFEQRSVLLSPGDLLFVYSDGISEAMNRADEEWGEERLQAAVGVARGRPAPELIEALFVEADAFAAGAVQHDDMTVVVVRMLRAS